MLTRRALVVSAGAIVAASLFRPSSRGVEGAGQLIRDPKGILDLPPGFTYRILARGDHLMSDGRRYPPDPDLNVYFARPDGTAYLVTNHEIAGERGAGYSGSVTRLHLDPHHRVIDSRLLAEGMRNNCSGCATPWGTILTCEEFPREPFEQFPGEGYVWEVDVETGEKYRRDAMGRFSHESATSMNGAFYLTEDFEGGFIYRFLPDRRVDLSTGRLFALDAARHRWVRIVDPYHAPAEAAAKGATPFHRLEGLVAIDGTHILLAETGAGPGTPYGRLLRLDTVTPMVSRFLRADGPKLAMPDNITTAPDGTVYVVEDKNGTNLGSWGFDKVLRVRDDRTLQVIARCRAGEPTGPAFTPDGKAMFLNIQDAAGGMTVVVEGFA